MMKAIENSTDFYVERYRSYKPAAAATAPAANGRPSTATTR